MSMASDLMGLGVSPLQAMKTSTGGTGPLVITPVGTTFASSTKIGCSQYLVTATAFASGLAVGLPQIGTDNGAYVADDFIVNNQGTSSLLVIASTSVLISMNGSLSSVQRVQSHNTATFYSVSTQASAVAAGTAAWIGVSGT
jgi:hypothetical protein